MINQDSGDVRPLVIEVMSVNCHNRGTHRNHDRSPTLPFTMAPSRTSLLCLIAAAVCCTAAADLVVSTTNGPVSGAQVGNAEVRTRHVACVLVTWRPLTLPIPPCVSSRV